MHTIPPPAPRHPHPYPKAMYISSNIPVFFNANIFSQYVACCCAASHNSTRRLDQNREPTNGKYYSFTWIGIDYVYRMFVWGLIIERAIDAMCHGRRRHRFCRCSHENQREQSMLCEINTFVGQADWVCVPLTSRASCWLQLKFHEYYYLCKYTYNAFIGPGCVVLAHMHVLGSSSFVQLSLLLLLLLLLTVEYFGKCLECLTMRRFHATQANRVSDLPETKFTSINGVSLFIQQQQKQHHQQSRLCTPENVRQFRKIFIES